MAIPQFTDRGDLPLGVHLATLREVLGRFGLGSPQRKVLARRLEHIYELAQTSGHLKRFVVFGSFVTQKPEPKDVDVFLLMEDTFDGSQLAGEMRLLFDHAAAQAHFGASVFWLRCLAATDGEYATVEYWQLKRGGGQRGIVEIISEAP